MAEPLPADDRAAAGATFSAPFVTRQRGGERVAVDVVDRHAGDRQRRVLVDGLRARHGVHRRSFTELTVIATASESVNAPSAVVTVSVSEPLKSGLPW